MSGPFSLPALPYDENALAPIISSQTVGLHHGKHHATYFAKLNDFVKDTDMESMSLEDIVVKSAKDGGGLFNNAGQAWNHIIYWEQMHLGGSRAPSGDLAAAIDAKFGSFDQFKSDFTAAAAGVFGSGWCWLVKSGDGVEIMGTSNADSPLAQGKTTLMGVDVWEHAYYLDYQNRRPDHVKALLDSAINWSFVDEKFNAGA